MNKKRKPGILAKLAFLALPFLPGKAQASDNWFTFQPGYNIKKEHSTARIEGGSKLKDKISTYGFIDLNASKEEPTNMQSVYAEGRINIQPTKQVPLALTAEYNGATFLEDTIRLGITYTPNLGKNNFTYLKYLPLETSGEHGQQATFFTSQQLTPRLRANLTADYNIDQKVLMLEPKVKLKLTDRVSAFVRNQSFTRPSFKKIREGIAPIIGLEFKF